MEKKKIASLFASLKVGGGVEKVQANLSIGLSDLGYDFYHIVSEDLDPKNDYKGKIISLNNPFILGFGIKKILSLFINSYKIARICKKEKIEILIGQGDYFFMLSGLVELFGFKGKNIAVVHTTIGIWPKYINLLLRFFLKLHNKVVLISREEYNIFINNYNFDKNKLEIIYNSIDLSKIDLLKNEKVDDFEFDKFTFINIGRLTYQKGQGNLIKAFDKFNKKYNNSQLIILGEGELKQEYLDLKNSLKSSKNIYLLGNKQNVYKYLNKSNCFVLSSNFEGFGLVLLDSMACGLPIVSTNCPSGPSEILNLTNSEISNLEITQNAILLPYNYNTQEFLFEAMEKIFLDEKLKITLSKNNLERVKDFDKNCIMEKWDNLIKTI